MATAALFMADPRAARIAAQLRSQQSVLAPRGLTIPPAYIDQVAETFVQLAKVGDLRDIEARFETAPGVYRESGDSAPFGTWMFYRKGESYPFWQEQPFAEWNYEVQGPQPFASSRDERFVFTVKWLEEPGIPVFWAVPNVRESWFAPLVPLIAMAASMAGLPALIGQSVLGAATAAAYPAASQALGTLALQTALTGGNVEAAARSVASSFAGAQFGDVVGTGLDSAAIGKVTAVAATTALQGGDVDKAVLRSLVDIGAKTMDEWGLAPEDYIDPGLLGDSGDWLSLADIGVTLDPVELSDALAINQDIFNAADIDPSSLFPDEYGNLFLPSGEYVEMSDAAFVDSIYMDAEGNIRSPDNAILVPSEDALNATVEELSAEIARQMDAGAGQTQTTQPAPASRPAAIPPAASQTKWPTITDATKTLDSIGRLAAQLRSTANAVQTGTYRPPAGSTSQVGTPRNTPVGVPVTLPDGRVVVNNGNGTQTIRNVDGSTVTVSSSYSGSTGAAGGLQPGVSNQALFIGGAVLIGAVLLARRR